LETLANTETVTDPARHQICRGEPWTEAAARQAIRDIVDDFAAARSADGTWPAHLLDGNGHRIGAYKGASGAIVALRILRRSGYDAPDFSEQLPTLHRRFLTTPESKDEPGLQLGEVGILTPAVLAQPGDAALGAALADAMERTLVHPAREITSGVTGMIHAALAVHRETADDRMAELARRGARQLLATWEERPDGAGWLWRSEVLGTVRHYYGACHGLAGNVGALFRARPLLADFPLETIIERTENALAAGALRDERGISWPVSADASGRRRLAHWCHGAPGVVIALAQVPDTGSAASARLDRMLLEAGELTWRAGPLRKGPGICHGTAGNGMALLALHHRTGDPRWLDRARAFAMHAIRQRQRHRTRFEQGRYTLWTGDGGLAVFLDQLLAGSTPALPGLDLF
jgi:lantibiotic modifying enzyme